MTAVLDTWPVIAFLKGESAAPRVRALLEEDALISAVNLGEAYYLTAREGGEARADAVVDDLRSVMRVEDSDWPVVRAAARVKARGGLSYADAFCVATAQRHRAPLYTGDPELIAMSDLVEVVDLRAAL